MRSVDWGRKRLVDFNAGKTRLASFDRSSNTGATNVKKDGSVVEENSSFQMLGLCKTVSKKIGALIRYMKLLFPDVAPYLYKFTIRACMEYCCPVWASALMCYLEPFDKLQKRICRIVGSSLAATLEPLVHCRNAAS